MFATVVAIICSIANPSNCVEKTVTSSDVDAHVTFMSCVASGIIGATDWFVKNGYAARGYNLANVRCIAGHYTPKVET